ncbi:MAG: PQQ-binding-like beta-propeller repeat protein [Planctomycetes bacterium]|nr:PQQ-binding-like beta-propeller repeat protein [Planctomycetota bacterium]
MGVEGGATLALVSPPAGVAVLLGTSAAFALRLSDGARAWETEFPIGTTGHFVSPPTESDPGAIGLGTKEAFVCLDPTTGRERFRLPAAVAGADAGAAPEEPAFEPALSAPGLFLGASNRRLLARSTRTGERLWTRELSDAPACPPVWRSGPLGLELYVATNDARLVQFDSAGREVREVLLHAAPFAIHADDLDADGRTDLILSGNGIQCIPSTRVLWRRSLTNAVRPRPRVLDLGGRKGVILPGKWDRDRSDLRCLDGATGAELWRSGGGFDTIFEPELRDMDGDGVLDVVLHTQAAPSGIVCVSGRDGRELSRFARCPICYAAPLFQDVDGDGKAEALVCVWGGGLQAWLPGAAEPLWSVPAAAVMTRPALGDLDGDGRPEVLLAFPGSGDKTGRAIAVDLAGRVRWSFDAPEYMRTTPAALDLDGDGAPEVLVAGARDLFVLGRDGRERARWPGMGGSLYAPTVVDADGDGRPELLLGTTRGVALLRRDGSAVWTYAAACVGGALEVAKLPCASGPAVVGIDGRGRFFVLELRTGREVWRWESGAACEGGVTLGDVDGDGVPEAFFGSHDQGLYAIDLR